ncbi:MAG: hypothetical protein RLY31_1238 [Bacteroidota bacterium]
MKKVPACRNTIWSNTDTPDNVVPAQFPEKPVCKPAARAEGHPIEDQRINGHPKTGLMSTIEFNSHFDSLQHKLLPFAYKLTNNLEDARDLVQETALRAYNNRDKFESGTNFRAWVTTIMRNTFINIYRKKKNRATISEPTNSHLFVNEDYATDNAAPATMAMRELENIVNRLDSIYRVPFLLFFEGYKYEEIAETMSLPIGTVKSRIFFARQKLMQAIQLHTDFRQASLN